MEVASLLKTDVEGADLLNTDTGVQSEHLEALRVLVQLAQEFHVFVHIEEGAFLRCSSKENCCVSAWDGVLLGRRLVIGSRLNFLDITKREWLVESLVKSGKSLNIAVRSSRLFS